jgi:DNA-binding XRE family transcriptional regulator
VEHRKADVRQATGRGASGDDAARFLRELRQLRDGAGLGQAELAARAHYPHDSIRAAEAGPALPDLPVLSAYVRGCGGTTEEWEERWRSLTRSPSLPVPAARHAGSSPAATAGARIGSASEAAEVPDPSVIIAALSRVAEEMASGGSGKLPASPADPRDAFPSGASSALPSGASSAVPPAVPAADAWSDDKPAGWDPIRVSTAWPAIKDTPAEAPTSFGDTGFSSETGSSGGPAWTTAAPWDAAPWAKDPSGSDGDADAATAGASTAATGAAEDGATSAAAAGAATGVPPAFGIAASESAAGGGRSPSRTRIVVLAAVLLCVLAVLLAIFA